MEADKDFLKRLLGKELNYKGGTVETQTLVGKDKVIGFFFGGQYCPPCKTFTPDLVNWYNNIKGGLRANTMDLIFISTDIDENAYQEYVKEMPWHCLPFGIVEKSKIVEKFGIESVPTLIFVNAMDGEILTVEGREEVLQDPLGKRFPYGEKTLSQMLEGTVITKADPLEYEQAVGKNYRALYFSAKWCPPCRLFTPLLIKVYNKLKEKNKPFEVIWCSCDASQDSMLEYYADMPWLALPFEDRRIPELKAFFNISNIPTLIIMDPNDKVLRVDGKQALMDDPEGNKFPWKTSTPLKEKLQACCSIL